MNKNELKASLANYFNVVLQTTDLPKALDSTLEELEELVIGGNFHAIADKNKIMQASYQQILNHLSAARQAIL